MRCHTIIYFAHDQSKASKETKIRNRSNQVPHLTHDTTWESDKNSSKHHAQESQEASPCPAGGHKAVMNRHESMANTKYKQQNDPQKKHCLGTVSKKYFHWGA